MPNETPTAVVDPVLALLRSRKTIVALATAVATLVVLAVPSLEKAQPALVTVFTVLGTMLIYAISKEDAALKSAPTTVNAGTGDVTLNQPPAAPPAAPDDTAQLHPVPPDDEPEPWRGWQ